MGKRDIAIHCHRQNDCSMKMGGNEKRVLVWAINVSQLLPTVRFWTKFQISDSLFASFNDKESVLKSGKRTSRKHTTTTSNAF